MFGFPDGSQEEIEPLPIVATDLAVERFDLLTDVVENALTVFHPLQFPGLFLGRAGDEEFAEDLGRPALGWNADAAPVPSGVAAAQDERRKARFVADMRGRLLVQRYPVLDIFVPNEFGR